MSQAKNQPHGGMGLERKHGPGWPETYDGWQAKRITCYH